MTNPVDVVRMVVAAQINADAAATPEQELRQRLEANYPGDVYDTAELQEKFDVISFAAPYVIVVRKDDDTKGSLEFTHRPRFYYNFVKGGK